ncbi:MAG: ABC transporter permease [Fibrobacteres bacterium]|nr:ABC transporter permease [Fibrobacterota bacterium]
MSGRLSGKARARALYLFTKAHLLEFFREPGVVFWAFGFPLLLSWALGLAFLSPKPLGTELVVSQADSAAVRQVVTDPSVRLRVLSEEAAMRALRRGEVAGRIATGPDGIRLEVDTASQDGVMARLLVERTLAGAANRVKVEAPVASAGNYADFLFPGMLALGLMNGCLWGIGFGLMDLRLRKLLRLFAATPLSRVDILLSVVLARMVILPLESGLLWGFGMVVFGVHLHGNVFLFVLAAASGAVAFSGIGVLAASRVGHNQAAYGIMNALTIPMTIVSGIFFSWTRFPSWLHPVVEWLPLTVLADLLRSISSEGAGLAHALPRVLVLLAWGLLAGSVGLRLFRWR